MKAQAIVGVSLTLQIVAIMAIYYPGLTGGFVFDDYPNLSPLGDFRSIHDWETFWTFIETGIAGPTGRPLALLSFLINDNTWPSDPRSFKYTNTLIHALNAVLLFWANYKILSVQNTNSDNSRCLIAALIAAMLWAFHPIHVSTTLYVVQRMTMLSATFTLAGILVYINAREHLSRRSELGWIGLLIATPLCGILACLNKENGVLLPAFLLVIEYAALSNPVKIQLSGSKSALIKIYLWVPTLIVLAFGITSLIYVDPEYSKLSRGYTAYERILTECRILISYLYDIFIPKTYGPGLYVDDYSISRGITEPLSTLVSAAALIAIILYAIFAINRTQYLALALLVFIVGHSLESIFTMLDLYYEHRNYMPSTFIFLPLAVWLVEYRGRLQIINRIAFLIYISFIALCTSLRVDLWANDLRRSAYWAGLHPESARAQREFANILVNYGYHSDAIAVMEELSRVKDKDLSVQIHFAIIQCSGSSEPTNTLKKMDALIEQNAFVFDSRLYQLLDALAGYLDGVRCGTVGPAQMLATLNKFRSISAYRDGTWSYMVDHLSGILNVRIGNIAGAVSDFRSAMAKNPQIDIGLVESAVLASHGYYHESIEHLSLIENFQKVFRQGLIGHLGAPARDFGPEITHLRNIVLEDIRSTARSAESSK